MHDEIIDGAVQKGGEASSPPRDIGKKFAPDDITTLAAGMAEALTGKQVPVTDLETVITNPMQTEIDEGSDAPVIANVGGVLHFGKEQLDQARERTVEHFKRMIKEGNEQAVEDYLWYIADQKHPDFEDIRLAVREAVKKKSTADLDFVLKKFTVVLPLRSLAERQLIKREVRKQIENLPFTFNDPKIAAFSDPSGIPLSCDIAKLDEGTNDIEFVFVKEGDGFKLVISSKKGIGPVGLLDNDQLSGLQYPIDKDNIDIDPDTKKITLKLLPPKTGDVPLFSTIEIRREAIPSLAKKLEEQENLMEDQDYQAQTPNLRTNKQPLPPRNTRPTTYVSVSPSSSH